ncbi:MAG: dUTP diphosphatase [Gemmatimonadota bacterium]|jgi:dUTP pyrophosphatase
MSEPGPDVVRVELLPDHPAFGRAASAEDAGLATAHSGDAGIDLVACEEATLPPGGRASVSAGIRIALPPGVEAQVRPRSGQALRRGLTCLNAPGTIDPGYRGPVRVILHNAAPALTPEELDGPADGLAARIAAGLAQRAIRIERGERIAQLVFARFERPRIEIVDHLPEDTARGAGGFGSTGTT